MALFKSFSKGMPDAHEPLNQNFAEIENMTIDGGMFSEAPPLDIHAAASGAHVNLVVDGNETGEAQEITPLEEHETDPLAHQNLVVSGSEF